MHFRVLSCFTGKVARYHKCPCVLIIFRPRPERPECHGSYRLEVIPRSDMGALRSAKGKASASTERGRALLGFIAGTRHRPLTRPCQNYIRYRNRNLTYSVYSNLPSWAFLSTRDYITDIPVYCTAPLYIVTRRCFCKVCTAHVWDGDYFGSLASHIVYEQIVRSLDVSSSHVVTCDLVWNLWRLWSVNQMSKAEELHHVKKSSLQLKLRLRAPWQQDRKWISGSKANSCWLYCHDCEDICRLLQCSWLYKAFYSAGYGVHFSLLKCHKYRCLLSCETRLYILSKGALVSIIWSLTTYSPKGTRLSFQKEVKGDLS